MFKEFQVYRWNPDSDEKPKYQSYQVDIANCGPMMLDVLLKVKDEQDQSLSFRRSCRCACVSEVRACTSLVARLWGGGANV